MSSATWLRAVVRQQAGVGLRFDQAVLHERPRVGAEPGRGGRVGRVGVGAIEGCRGVGTGQVARQVGAALVEEDHVVVALDRLREAVSVAHRRLDAGRARAAGRRHEHALAGALGRVTLDGERDLGRRAGVMEMIEWHGQRDALEALSLVLGTRRGRRPAAVARSLAGRRSALATGPRQARPP